MEFFRFGAEVAAGEEAATGYWMRWQTVVCALIVVAPAVAAVVVAARARARPLRAVDLWAPCWAGMHPAWLLAYRGLVFLAMGWLLFQMVLFRGFSAFYFYTHKVCRFASYRPVHTGPLADRYVDRPLPGDTLDVAPYQTIRGCFRHVIARNRSVTVNFDRHRLLPGSISLAATRKREKK
ncbi:hypothetical protein BHM03_00038746 [Ensete ventricosum]|nr:hypothetical protein BHM03_00038746 [Ensete ventricosum]